MGERAPLSRSTTAGGRRRKKKTKKRAREHRPVAHRIKLKAIPLLSPPKNSSSYLELLDLLVLFGADALLRELLRGELEVEDLVEQLVAHPAATAG